MSRRRMYYVDGGCKNMSRRRLYHRVQTGNALSCADGECIIMSMGNVLSCQDGECIIMSRRRMHYYVQTGNGRGMYYRVQTRNVLSCRGMHYRIQTGNALSCPDEESCAVSCRNCSSLILAQFRSERCGDVPRTSLILAQFRSERCGDVPRTTPPPPPPFPIG